MGAECVDFSVRDVELGAHGTKLGGVLSALRVVRVHRVSVGAAPLLDKGVPFEEFGREDGGDA